MKQKLSKAAFIQVVRNAPLVSVDLILQNEFGWIGLGLRRNEPARGKFYFLGGRIYKGERIEQTCGRVLQSEAGIKRPQLAMTICGVNNWFFNTNFAGVRGVSTHYVALAIMVKVNGDEITTKAVQSQHLEFRWFAVDQLLVSGEVHEDVKHVIRHLETKK